MLIFKLGILCCLAVLMENAPSPIAKSNKTETEMPKLLSNCTCLYQDRIMKLLNELMKRLPSFPRPIEPFAPFGNASREQVFSDKSWQLVNRFHNESIKFQLHRDPDESQRLSLLSDRYEMRGQRRPFESTHLYESRRPERPERIEIERLERIKMERPERVEMERPQRVEMERPERIKMEHLERNEMELEFE